MRITSANIPAQAAKRPTADIIPAADRSSANRRDIKTWGSYNKNSSGATQVIDAEYVEFYTPSTGLFSKERQSLDNTLEPETTETHPSGNMSPADNISPALAKYQLKTYDTPPPGSFIDFFV